MSLPILQQQCLTSKTSRAATAVLLSSSSNRAATTATALSPSLLQSSFSLQLKNKIFFLNNNSFYQSRSIVTITKTTAASSSKGDQRKEKQELQPQQNKNKTTTTTTTSFKMNKKNIMIPRKAAISITPKARTILKQIINITKSHGILLKYEISSQHALRMAFKFVLIKDITTAQLHSHLPIQHQIHLPYIVVNYLPILLVS
jgi:hypothetical protein